MSDEWHYRAFGQEFGPVTFEMLADLARGGTLGRDDEVRQSSDGIWRKAGVVPGLFGPAAAQPEELHDLAELDFQFVESSSAPAGPTSARSLPATRRQEARIAPPAGERPPREAAVGSEPAPAFPTSREADVGSADSAGQVDHSVAASKPAPSGPAVLAGRTPGRGEAEAATVDPGSEPPSESRSHAAPIRNRSSSRRASPEPRGWLARLRSRPAAAAYAGLALVGAVLLVFGLTGLVASRGESSAGAGADSGLKEIRESFDRGRVNAHWWILDERSPPGVRVDLSQDALRFVIPAGPAGRPAATLKSRFRVEGDFAVEVDYSARALPQPESEWINIQIFVDGPDGPAAVIRSSHSKEGHGHSLWWESPEEGVPGAWRQEPTTSARGTLRLSRRGQRLVFEYADGNAHIDPASDAPREFVEIGGVAYGDRPVTNVELWVTVPETQSLVDVTFDNVLVRADRIIDTSVIADVPVGPRVRYGVLVVAAASLLGFAGWRLWRRH